MRRRGDGLNGRMALRLYARGRQRVGIGSHITSQRAASPNNICAFWNGWDGDAVEKRAGLRGTEVRQ